MLQGYTFGGVEEFIRLRQGADKLTGGDDPVPAALARASAAQVGALGEETVINTGARQHGGKLNLSARASVSWLKCHRRSR